VAPFRLRLEVEAIGPTIQLEWANRDQMAGLFPHCSLEVKKDLDFEIHPLGDEVFPPVLFFQGAVTAQRELADKNLLSQAEREMTPCRSLAARFLHEHPHKLRRILGFSPATATFEDVRARTHLPELINF